MSRLLLAWALNATYLLLLTVGLPLIVWGAIRKGKYREGFAEKILGQVPRRTGSQHCVWIHAVSVGEVNLLATLIAELHARQPDLEVVVSTTTKTGYELARKKYGNRQTVFYCPIDFSWAVRRAMRRVRPDLLVLAELELWPNLIAAAKTQGAKVAIVNGRLSDNSYQGYRRLGLLTRHVLRQIDLIAAQDDATANRFRQLRLPPNGTSQHGISGVASDQTIIVTGSLKYDGAQADRKNPRTESLRKLACFEESHTVWLAGSTQAPEEEIALRVFSELSPTHPELRLLLVPRHPERFEEVAKLLQSSGQTWQRRSQLDSAGNQPTGPPVLPLKVPPPKIILVDTVGELGAWWGMATIGLVGGSFGDRGGQNMIEPAAYGVATCFGPNTRNFRDIVAALLAAKGARVVQDEQQLQQFVAQCLDNPAYAAKLGQRAQAFVATQLGATVRTADLLEALLLEPPVSDCPTQHAAA